MQQVRPGPAAAVPGGDVPQYMPRAPQMPAEPRPQMAAVPRPELGVVRPTGGGEASGAQAQAAAAGNNDVENVS